MAGARGDVSALKTVALLGVVAAHSLVWTTKADGSAASTLDVVPGMWWVTWLLQVLPLFFVLSTAGMRRLAESADGRTLASRVSMLVAPVLPLYAFALIAVPVVGRVSPGRSHDVGVLAVQLTWFIGVYVLILAASPVIVRTTDVGMIWWVVGIAAVDAVRASVWAPAGWLNMFAVWASFMVLGFRMDRLRALPRVRVSAAMAVALTAAAALIAFGPYSKALVSSAALPGLSNLAPPSLVLLCFGTAQTLGLVLAEPWIDMLLHVRLIDKVLSALTMRAMQIYLYHLVVVGVLAAAVLGMGARPDTLSPGWWALHAAVFAVAVGIAYLLAPAAQTAAGALIMLATRAWPMRGAPGKRAVTALSTAIGICMIVLAGRGVDALLTPRGGTGLGIPPLALLVVIVAGSSWLAAASAKRGTVAPPA